jgi:diguanylate cyclase (GGDEF)-like protein/PAS domain S-box-containing protein
MSSGVAAYAAVHQLGLGLTRPRNPGHLLLFAIALCFSVGAFFHSEMVRATSLPALTQALKCNVGANLTGMALLPWFVAGYVGDRRRLLLGVLTACFMVLLVAHTQLPYGLQYGRIDDIYTLALPWGEVISRAHGTSGIWVRLSALTLLADLAYILSALFAAYRRNGQAGSLWMVGGVAVFLACATEGVLVRLGLIDFIELGPLGLAYMVTVIGAAAARGTKQRLRSSEANYQALFENAPHAVIAIAPGTGRILEANGAAAAILGYSKEALGARTLADLTEANDREAVQVLMDRCVAGVLERLRFDAWMVRADGSSILMDCQACAFQGASGEPARIMVSATDITEQRRTEQALRESEARLRALIAQSPVAIAFARDGITVDVNAAYLKTFGYTSVDALRGRPLIEQIAPQCRPDTERRIRRRIDAEDVESIYETTGLRSDNTQFPVFVSAKRLAFRDGPVTIAFLIDMSRQKASDEEIRRLAFYDQLTDLANRQLLNDRLRQALASCGRTGRHCALLLIDLDNFKAINDTQGYAAGDALLVAVARRLSALFPGGDPVARLGGDEFVVLLEDLSAQPAEAAAQAEALGERIRQALANAHLNESGQVRCTCSIGITVSRDHHLVAEDLIRQADIAMYEAKSHGRNLLRFFDPRMQELINARVLLESDLHGALESGQFVLHYQIQVDSSFLPVGAEALIRWNHPQRGMVAPGSFIGLAEETGLIVPIGGWVLDAACAQLEQWRHNPLIAGLTVAINVSSKQFRQAGFVEEVRSALQRHRIDPARLKLELTESMLIEDVEAVIATLHSLRALGVKFSLDDFGTGYSSLQYLKRLPLDQLKIDQSFVRDIAIDPNDHAIVRTVIAVARSLNLDVIAEGVETEEQRRLLVDCGCTHFQGYLFGKPSPAANLELQIEANLIGLRGAPVATQLPVRVGSSARS